MAKRTLGLGKAAKAKKQKTESASESATPVPATTSTTTGAASNEITVELDDEVDPDDELAQLKGLWNTYLRSERDNEYVLNGIVHECDRLLRNEQDKSKLSAEFHAIYAVTLAELAIFHTEDETKGSTVKEFFDAALERIELGQESYPDAAELRLAKARVILSRIPLEYISKMDVDTTSKKFEVNVAKLLDEALESYTAAEETIESTKEYKLFDQNTFEILNSLDDLLDIIHTFGKSDELAEGLDSDEEDSDAEEEVQLSKKHPLYKIQHSDKYSAWLQTHQVKFAELITIQYKDTLLSKSTEQLSESEQTQLHFYKQVCKKTGQVLLQTAEPLSQIFTSLTYDSDNEEEAIDGVSASEAQTKAIKLTKQAVEFFKKAEEDEDPQSWVDVAEAIIDLGNLYDYESKDQVDAYAVAEERLKRANNATNGKFQTILDDLLNKDEE
ncbi:hypothetical protein WICPIJ_001373 [Wickerhamomyces pijperi]|uniref:Enhancer of translation termination 1 n=1 Tax=Wickerhamomyces pijperi TaxID=599730 RepID=A0A9P8QBT7_WICPI|nr:hypothetical protein WICPIJ_001373 [Wickerhamomyces pijperi]